MTKKATAKKKAAKSGADITLLKKTSRAEEVAPGVLDIYPAIDRPATIVNSAALHLPIELSVSLRGCIALVVPHPVVVRKKQLFPEIITGIVPPGDSHLVELTVRNQGFRAVTVDPDEPIARMVLLNGDMPKAVISAYEEVPDAA